MAGVDGLRQVTMAVERPHDAWGEDMDEAQILLLRAYEKARLSGKPNWTSMTTAVLKNRLLALTDGTFDEAEYGASNFTEFVLQNQSILSLDRSVFPPLVELIETTSISHPPADVAVAESGYRIRSDLWRAVLDYSSGTQYVWDVAASLAIPADKNDNERTIPTATQSVQRKWREAFRNTIEGTTNAEEESQINSWIDRHLAASHLPDRLMAKWNDCFREHVRNHLLNWFSESDLNPPDDLISPFKRKSDVLSPETEGLREFVLSVIRTMTHEELTRLLLPPAAVLRSQRSLSS